jgi:3-dehydro-L-gulonate 2-dehydrogenase
MDVMQEVLSSTLVDVGFEKTRARRCASIFVDNSAAGVASHGLNRFALFVDFVRRGIVDPAAEITCTARFGAWEQWDGCLGPGPLNAFDATRRAMTLAQQYGIGCVGLKQTNHWMRGGYYGWMAAEAGLALLAWTNTTPNMPPWGARECRLGNNPLVLAVPRQNGPVVLDMAMSQFSYGRLESTLRKGGSLPVPGGYDTDGELTTEAGEILRSQRVLPIGFWKGAGLSLLLDSLAALVSGGDATCRIGRREPEYGVSQVYIAVDVARSGEQEAVDRTMDAIVADLYAAEAGEGDAGVRYPGEQVRRKRRESAEKGVPVDEAIWERVRAGL